MLPLPLRLCTSLRLRVPVPLVRFVARGHFQEVGGEEIKDRQ